MRTVKEVIKEKQVEKLGRYMGIACGIALIITFCSAVTGIFLSLVIFFMAFSILFTGGLILFVCPESFTKGWNPSEEKLKKWGTKVFPEVEKEFKNAEKKFKEQQKLKEDFEEFLQP